MELKTPLQGNPIKGILPTFETAHFTTDDNLQMVSVWRDCATGLMETYLYTRPSVDVFWGSPIRFSRVD